MARRTEVWSYDRLLSESDLVAIASVESTSNAELSSPPEFGKLKTRALVTKFQVHGLLKGQAQQVLQVLHFKLLPDQPTQGGPRLVEFRTSSEAADDTRERKSGMPTVIKGGPDYLLYLRAAKNGLYEPITGQYDAASSFKEIYGVVE